MKGLRAGGLALVYGLQKQTAANGKCVELVRVVYPLQFFTRPTDGTKAVMEDDGGGPAWLVTGDVTTSKGHHGYGLFSPANLMPIDDCDPDAVDELTKDKPAELTA
ncbi:hypothetical protein MQ4_28 [Serratia phage MQ-4]|nr:hypothetical protein MQ4_28 [Serratia phage MQ-4]